MIKFKRKTTADVITTNDGIEHPDLVLILNGFHADMINNNVQMRFGYYHDIAAFNDSNRVIDPMLFGINRINLSFTQNSNVKYHQVMSLLNFDASGTSFTNPDAVTNWFLGQPDPLDSSKLLGDDWEVLTS